MALEKTVSFSKNAVNVFFHLLTRCNLSCKHCYINPEQHGNRTVDVETAERWLKAFYPLHQKANVIFLGGEPTLHPDLDQIVKTARSMGYRSITIDTNGYLFNDILDRLSSNDVDAMSFSLDGSTPQINDPIRGTGSFERCTNGIRKAVEKGFHTSLIYTVSQSNLMDLEKMPPLLKRLGIHHFFIQVIGIRGKSACNGEKHQVSKEHWLAVIPKVAETAAILGIPTTYPKVFLEAGEIFECAGLVAKNYFIFPNARVYRCPLCEDFPLHGFEFENGKLKETPKINEIDLFRLDIPEGCVMNKLIQPANLSYRADGSPEYRIGCCMLKEEVRLA
jgi:MoaA/NifB/PqqE/SkfB family radical SAM enzyme